MDCDTAAASLKKLLVAHDHAGIQLSALDAQIIEISRQTLVSALDSNRSQDLHLSLRLSVCEGVKVMYHSYKNKKWSQVQEIARSIIENLEADHDADMTTPVPSSPSVTSSVTLSPPGGSTSVDKAADKWSLAFCEFYRDN